MICLFGILLLFFAARPLFTMVVVIGFCQGMLADAIGDPVMGILTGIFLCVITSIVFRFVGNIVHSSADVIMYCMALEAETGTKQQRFEEMGAYKVIKEVTN